jgi:hypothetical protein
LGAAEAFGLTAADGVEPAPVAADWAQYAGAPSSTTEAAIKPEQKSLKDVVTKSLDSNRWPSLWHKKKTCNIRNLRRLPQVPY